MAEQKLAIVRVRGENNMRHEVERTLSQLLLHHKNFCVVVPNTPSYAGMVAKVKDFVTWGEIDDATYKQLVEKRGEEYKGRTEDLQGKIKYNKSTDVDGKKIKKFFRLNSPTKGYGSKGIKMPFGKGGALGYRGDKIKDLIAKMM